MFARLLISLSPARPARAATEAVGPTGGPHAGAAVRAALRRRVALAVRRGRERTPTVAATRQGSCSRSWRRSGVSHAGHGLSHGRLAVPRAPAARAGSRLLDPIGLCCRLGRYGWQIGAACANNRWQGRAGRCVRRPHERFYRAGGCAEAPRRVYGRWVRRWS